MNDKKPSEKEIKDALKESLDEHVLLKLKRNPQFAPIIIAKEEQKANEEHRDAQIKMFENFIKASKEQWDGVTEKLSDGLLETKSEAIGELKEVVNNIKLAYEIIDNSVKEGVKDKSQNFEELCRIGNLLQAIKEKDVYVNVEAPEVPEPKIIDKTQIVQESKHIEQAVQVLVKILETMATKGTDNVRIVNRKPGEAIPVTLTDAAQKRFTDAIAQIAVGGSGSNAVKDVNILPLKGVVNGAKTVASGGTAAALGGDVSINSVSIVALSTNAGNIYIGDSDVDSSNGYPLVPGQDKTFDIDNLSKLFYDGTTSDEIRFIALTKT